MKTAKPTSIININPAILPLEELRQLVFEIVLRDSIEPFVWRVIILLDSIKAGQTDEVARIAHQSKDTAFTRLMSALTEAVEEGELAAARITAFLAAGYAYQESLNYYWDLMSYLDKIRGDAKQARNPLSSAAGGLTPISTRHPMPAITRMKPKNVDESQAEAGRVQ